MCDYSLHAVPNRLAVEGEELITHQFPTYSIGLVSVAEVERAVDPPSRSEIHRSWWSALNNWLSARPPRQRVTAICIPPGARLRASRIPRHIQREFDIGPVEEVTFVQLGLEAYQYRDAIRLWNGRTVLLQLLHEGVRFKMLSLSSTETEPLPEVELELAWRGFY